MMSVLMMFVCKPQFNNDASSTGTGQVTEMQYIPKGMEQFTSTTNEKVKN